MLFVTTYCIYKSTKVTPFENIKILTRPSLVLLTYSQANWYPILRFCKTEIAETPSKRIVKSLRNIRSCFFCDQLANFGGSRKFTNQSSETHLKILF